MCKENRKNSHKPHRIDQCTPFVQWVVTQVRTKKWSIDACVGYARKKGIFPEEEMVCTKTLYTVDNGAEFANFAQIEKYGTKIYFAHPYTSWE